MEAYNLAFQKPTWQSETLLTYSSDKAVDGHFMNRSITGNECAISGGNVTEVTWYVDLESIQKNLAKFHHTFSSPAYNGIMQSGRAVDGRKTDLSAYGDYYPSRFKGFSLIISNTTNHRDGVTCYKDVSDAKTSIPPVMDIMCSVVGRYVIYYNERIPEYGSRPGYSPEAFAELCEVEVYDLENVAFLKPTWMSNSMIWSDKAVDGKYTNLHWNGGQCTMSSLSQTATLWVNLEMDVAIDHVVIYFRTDNGPLGVK
uniref:Uncharacterized protein LOC111113772 n=1 Tax=Crassostrea virginica TaxID=6565 RepID=A0A8B8BY41_CRAVI|nr:uncharacterized protein LOC111113772 [Crassostrea virginica]